jgi:hypothetical protein
MGWVAGLAIACAVGAVLLLLFHRAQAKMKWPLVQGSIEDTRIVADHGVETKWGGQISWKAEYKVAYFAGGHEYTVWADSGLRGENEAEVRLALPRSHRPVCRVGYDPQRPDISIVDCR